MTSCPLIRSDHGGEHQRRKDGERKRPMRVDEGGRERETGEGDHGSDREIELPADHEQGCRDRQNAELRSGRENRHCAAEREHRRVGGDEKEDEDDDQPGDRSEFGLRIASVTIYVFRRRSSTWRRVAAAAGAMTLLVVSLYDV